MSYLLMYINYVCSFNQYIYLFYMHDNICDRTKFQMPCHGIEHKQFSPKQLATCLCIAESEKRLVCITELPEI